MSKKKLTKEEALELVASIVDNEVDEEIRSAFFRYIDTDDDVRKEFESIKRIKTLISTRCPSYKAPQTLKLRIQEFLVGKKKPPKQSGKKTDVDRPSQISSSNSDRSHQTSATSLGLYKKWLYAAAATFLIITASWGLIYNNENLVDTYSMEEYVYKHFENHNGELVPTTISTANLADAEIQLSSNFNFTLTVPPLKNAEFKGVAYNEFVPNFEAPLLEYYLPMEDQYIYIFAFNLNKLDEFGKIARDDEAIKKCTQPQDFHIENVNGKHVVSWRWNDIWYAAISNHDGNTLASLVKPLKHTP